ncbi:hypothetical protein P3T16_001740 [Paraburkholderia sp. GAS42]
MLSDYGLKAQQGAFVMTIVGVAMMAGRVGFALGSEVDALAYMASRVFGRRHLGAVYGSPMLPTSVVSLCATVISQGSRAQPALPTEQATPASRGSTSQQE